MEVFLPTLLDLQSEAATFAKGLTPHTEHATLIALSGDLGAGKTSFVQGMAQALGVTETVTSPTFVIQKIYPLEAGAWKQLVHMDAYRLEEPGALHTTGFSDLYADPSTLIALEWPSLVSTDLPIPDQHITLAVSGEGRTITYG